MWLLGFIQATNGSPSTHDVILTNGRKKCSGSVGRVLNWGSMDCYFETHQSHSVVSLGKMLYQLLSNG